MGEIKLFVISLFFMGLAFTSHAQIDTLSYALGYETTLGLFAGELKMFKSEADFENYIRGLEEGIRKSTALTDSAIMFNYSFGSVQGVYLANSIEHTPTEEKPDVSCIIKGLMKVADNELTLPADTTGFAKYMGKVQQAGGPAKLSKDEKCLFFTRFGIMKGLTDNLQQWIDESDAAGIKADSRYYALGMAEMLAMIDMTATNPYNLGRLIGFSIGMKRGELPCSLDYFVNGARAAFGMDEPIVPRKEIEARLMRFYCADSVQTEDPTLAVEINGREIDSGTVLDVDWDVKIYAMPEIDRISKNMRDSIISIRDRFCNQVGIKKLVPLRFSEFMWFFSIPELSRETIAKYISQLPEFGNDMSWKWFYLKDMNGGWTFGIADYKNPFIAKVRKASLQIFDDLKRQIDFSYSFGNDEDKEKTAEWAAFTKANSGKPVIIEINGEAMYAPLINGEITGGACFLSVPLEEAERLIPKQ